MSDKKILMEIDPRLEGLVKHLENILETTEKDAEIGTILCEISHIKAVQPVDEEELARIPFFERIHADMVKLGNQMSNGVSAEQINGIYTNIADWKESVFFKFAANYIGEYENVINQLSKHLLNAKQAAEKIQSIASQINQEEEYIRQKQQRNSDRKVLTGIMGVIVAYMQDHTEEILDYMREFGVSGIDA